LDLKYKWTKRSLQRHQILQRRSRVFNLSH
jgi:hypothetical protein